MPHGGCRLQAQRRGKGGGCTLSCNGWRSAEEEGRLRPSPSVGFRSKSVLGEEGGRAQEGRGKLPWSLDVSGWERRAFSDTCVAGGPLGSAPHECFQKGRSTARACGHTPSHAQEVLWVQGLPQGPSLTALPCPAAERGVPTNHRRSQPPADQVPVGPGRPGWGWLVGGCCSHS